MDYAELQTTIGDYLDRSDLSGTTPTFISLAEAKFKRKLRHWKMEKRATADTVAGQRTLQLPSDFLQMRHIKVNTDPVAVLEFKPPSQLNYQDSGSGTIKYFSIVGDELVFDDTPDGVYQVEMYYYAFEPLSISNTSNWLLENYPDAYIYGALLEAEAYLMNDPRLQIWKLGLEEAIKDLNKSSKMAHYGSTPLVQRPG